MCNNSKTKRLQNSMCWEILKCAFFKVIERKLSSSIFPNEAPEALTEFFPEPGSKPLGQAHSMLLNEDSLEWRQPLISWAAAHRPELQFLPDRGMDLTVPGLFFLISHYYYCTSHAVPIIRRKHPSWRTSTGKKKWSRWWKQAEVATGRWCTRIDTWKVKSKD